MADGINKSLYSPQQSNHYSHLAGGTPHKGVISTTPSAVGILQHTRGVQKLSLYDSIGYDQEAKPKDFIGVAHSNLLGRKTKSGGQVDSLYRYTGTWEQGTRNLTGQIVGRTLWGKAVNVNIPQSTHVIEYHYHRQKEKYKGVIRRPLIGVLADRPLLPLEYVVKHYIFDPREGLKGVYGTPFDRINEDKKGEGEALRPRAFPSTHLPKRR